MKSIKNIKPLNTITLGYGYLASTITRSSKIIGMPVSAGIEITNHCNLNCPECLSGSGKMTRARGFMKRGLFNIILDELTPYLYNINLYFQGEPMLHPQFFSFLERVKKIRMTVSTNGHFLSEKNSEKLVESGLNKLIVSLDGLDQETFSEYRRGGEADKVISGIRYISEAIHRSGSKIELEIQLLVNRYNEYQIKQIRRFAHEVNANLRLKSMQIMNYEHIEEWLPANEKFRRYKIKDSNYYLKNTLSNRCLRLWLNTVITWDGKVVPCSFDKDAENIMGDLNKNSFREIWYGEKFKTFRDLVLKKRRTIKICQNCTSGLRGVRY